MIDFRYHLVSLIAVFLAVALGIIIGTTALNEPIQADIEGQVTDLEQDKRALEDRTQQLQAQLDTADSFADAVAPVLVERRAGRPQRPAGRDQRGRRRRRPSRTSARSSARPAAPSAARSACSRSTATPSTATSLQNYVTGAGLPAGHPAARRPTTPASWSAPCWPRC